MRSTYLFISKLKNLADKTYETNDIEQLQKDLDEINTLYDDFMNDEINVLKLEKEAVLKKYIKVSKIDAYNLPIIKKNSLTLRESYDKFHGRNNDHDSCGLSWKGY